MHFSRSVLGLLLAAVSLTSASRYEKRNETKRYAILDNDWSTAGFIPFLMALDAGIEILALTSCKYRNFFIHLLPEPQSARKAFM
jgi:hypothetical protein